MKKSLSISALVVIFIAELAGILGILYLMYCMRVQAELFNSMTEEVIEVENDVEELRALLYKYEYDMLSELITSDSENEETLKELARTELQIRNQLMIHGQIMQRMEKGSQREILFRNVNDDILKYLNFNVVILSMKGVEEPEAMGLFAQNNIFPLMKSVNQSIDTLSSINKSYIEQSKLEVSSYQESSHFFAIAGFIVIIIAIIISIIYSYRILNNLEEKNSFFKEKSESNEKRITEIQNNTIMGIADLVESRSGETGQHVKRTSHLVNLILLQAKKQGKWAEILSDQYIDYVTRAAPMHDLGKIIISDTILNKPGKLTPEEFEIMKTHAEAGGKIIHDIIGGVAEKEYVDIAADIANYHHEKWNGKGYPTGRKGKEIPLCARVMAVADVFDALIAERCYKKPMSYEDAFALIEREAGEHFDPEVVGLFLELKDEIYAER
ncbi:MAG: HD domain-containing protein [Treponemataceae bacterium]|nr:HD domain-containing protein [Treponemataceae bacterium]